MYATYLFTFSAAASRYYKILCQKQLLKSKGTHHQRKKHGRHREGIVRVSDGCILVSIPVWPCGD